MGQKPERDLNVIETHHGVPAKSVKRDKWRCFLRILFMVLVVTSIPLVFLATGQGQRLVLHWVDKALDGLSIGNIEGSLQEGLSLKNTQFKLDGVDIQAGQLDLHIGLRCLLDKRVCVENIALQDTLIVVDTEKLPPPAPKEDEPLGEINFPLPISLNQLSLDNVQVKVDEVGIQLHHFHSGLQGEGNNLQLSPTVLDGLKLSLPATKEDLQGGNSDKKIANSNPLETKQSIDWEAIKQQLAKPILTKLEPIKLALNVAIPDFVAKNIEIEQRSPRVEGAEALSKSLVKILSVNVVGKSDEQSIHLETLNIQTDKGSIAGQGQLMLEGEYPLNWVLAAHTPELPEFNLPASQAEANLSGTLFGETALSVKTAGVVAANIQGSVQLTEPKMPLNLTINSQEVNYPWRKEKGANAFKLKDLNVALSGDLLNYQLGSSVLVSGDTIPTSKVELKGSGELTQFTLEKLTLNALQGKANIVGNVDWSNGVEWHSQASLTNINSQSLPLDWSAILSGDLQTQGFAGRGETGEQWKVEVSKMDLHGSVFNKNLQLKGTLVADSQTGINVSETRLIYGENHIALNGVLGDNSNFNADINAPNLYGLVPNLKASVKGNIHLQGKISEPSLDLDLLANNISYEQTALQHLSAKGKITTEKEIVGNIELGVRQFSHGEIKLENANLIVTGNEKNHTLKLTSTGEPVAANLQLAGSFERAQQSWKGLLSQIAIHSPIGEWKSDNTIGVAYNNKLMQAEITAHCWNNPHLNICFPHTFKVGKEGKLPFEIKSFELNAMQPFLGEDSQLSGVISAKGDAAWFENKSPIVNLELNSNGIHFVQKMDYSQFPITLNPLKITANFAENNLKLNTDIQVKENGRLVGDLLIRDVANARALSGSIILEKFDAGLIKPLLLKGDSVEGNLNARLTVGGTALSPLLYGNLNLNGLKAKSSIMPFDLTEGSLSAKFNGASSTLKGSLQTQESTLLLEGDADWQKLEAWHTRIRAKANRFRVNVPSLARVDISPNIEVKATPHQLFLSGTVDVPWARIVVEELPESAVTVSSDEVIIQGLKKHRIGAQQSTLNVKLPDEMGKGMQIKADISVNIGKDPKEKVNLNAYGFKTDLQGTLKVRQGNKGLGLYGQVNLMNGKFASFGQDLVVRKGVVSFTGLPSQPVLDVEAIRNPEAMEDPSIVAGVKVTGIADAPEVKIFSHPTMAQDQALSYILTGRSLENSNDAGSSNSIAAALIGMSLSKSSKVVGGIGSTFGITDLNVSTAGIGDNAKVVVSGSLSPRFKVKYGIGIFAPLTELTLRYRLAPSLYLQSISNVNQALDLLYRFEFD